MTGEDLQARAEAWLLSPTGQEDAALIIIDLLEALDARPAPVLVPASASAPVSVPAARAARVLSAINQTPGLSTQEIADLLEMSYSNARRAVALLCRQGHIAPSGTRKFLGRGHGTSPICYSAVQDAS